MATIDELQVLITANAEAFSREMSKVNGELAQMKNASKIGGKALSGLGLAGVAVGTMIGNALSKAALAIGSHMGDAIGQFDAVNNFPKVMSNLGISAKDSQKSISALKEGLRDLPTSITDASMAVQRFTSSNGNIKASTAMFLALNNAILSGGASTEIQKSAMEQLSQAYAKGKPDMMEWRTAMMAMPAQLKQVAQSMGFVSASDLGEDLREGKVSMNEFMANIIKLNREGVGGFASFAEQARNSTGGVANSLAGLRKTIANAITDIMNIVGSANISGFFSAISRAINAAVPYIAGFVKVVMLAVSGLRALFGGKSSPVKATAEVKQNLEGAGGGAQNLASGAGDAGKKLGGAAKNAKKLADQLAGFDEMNVLKTPEPSSGGGGGGGSGSGGGGGGSMGASTEGLEGWDDSGKLDAVAQKAEEIANKIRGFFENMFDFAKIGAAFNDFWEGLKSAGSAVFAVIVDVWKSYILPFISWAGNDFLPAFLRATGAALELLAKVISKAWNSFLKPFIDMFLVPIAKFTGGIIVGWLEGFANACRKLAQNEVAVSLLAAALSGLIVKAVAGKVAVVAIDALTLAFGKLGAIKAILLNASGAFSAFSKGIISLPTMLSSLSGGFAGIMGKVGSLGVAMKSAGGIFTALGGAAKGLFAVLAANPIGAVVAVLGLLFATSEDFRNGVMALINSALKPLGVIFQSLMNLVQPIVDIFLKLVEIALKPLFGILNIVGTALGKLFEFLAPILEVVGKVALAFSPLNLALRALEPILKAIGWVLDIISKALDEVGKFFGWVGEQIGKFFEPMIKSVNAVMVEAKKHIDNFVKGLPDWAKNLLGVKDSTAETAKETAKLREENKELKTSVDDVIEAENKLNGTRASLAGGLAGLIESTSQINAKLQEMGAASEFSREKLAEVGQKMLEAKTPADQLAIASEALGVKLDANNASHLRQIEAIIQLSQKQDEYNSKADAAKVSTENLTKAMNDTRFSSEGVRNSFIDVIKKFQDGGLNADQLGRKLADLKAKGDKESLELRDAIIRNADAFGAKWDETQNKMITSSTNSSNKISEESKKATALMTQNLGKIGEAAGVSAGKTASSFAGTGSNIGGQGYEAQKQMAQNLGKMSDAGKIGADAVRGKFENFRHEFGRYASFALQGLSIGGGPFGSIAATWANGLMGTFKRVLGIHSPSRVFMGFGGFVGEGFTLGVESEQKHALAALNGLTDGFKPEIPPFEIAPLNSTDFSKNLSGAGVLGSFDQHIEATLSDKIEDLCKTPINLTVNVGNEKMLEQLIDGVNSRSFLENRTVFDI